MAYGQYSIGGSAKRKSTAKRQKTVFEDAQEVCHIWSTQTQSYGRNPQGNIYFEGATLYSYGSHFRIATILSPKTKGGCRQVLFNSASYSDTTAKQKNYAWRAIPPDCDVWFVPIVPRDGWPMSKADHVANVAHYVDEFYALAEKQRKTLTQDYRSNAMRRLANALGYATEFRCLKALNAKTRKLLAIAKESADPSTELSIEDAFYQASGWNEADIARDLRRAQRREEREAARRLAETKSNEEREAVRAKYRVAGIAAWRRGESTTTLLNPMECLPNRPADLGGPEIPIRIWDVIPDETALLRLSAEGQTVETSFGARVSLDDARQAWEWLRNRVAQENEESTGKLSESLADGRRHIGPYRVERFDGANLTIGCHTIPASEIALMAEALGLTETPACHGALAEL